MNRIDRWRTFRRARWVGNIIAAILLIAGLISLASIPDDLAKWAALGPTIRSWLHTLSSVLAGDVGRWTMVVIGVGLLFFFNFRPAVPAEHQDKAAQPMPADDPSRRSVPTSERAKSRLLDPDSQPSDWVSKKWELPPAEGLPPVASGAGPAAGLLDAVEEARRGVELAEAELVAFDQVNAGLWFSGKEHDRQLLVQNLERLRVAHLQALHAEERRAQLAQGTLPAVVDPQQRGPVRELMHEARVRLEKDRDLVRTSANADARAADLRLFIDGWEPRLERALEGDPATLTALQRPVDTSQMHYVESPAHVLRVKLHRLTGYLTPGEAPSHSSRPESPSEKQKTHGQRAAGMPSAITPEEELRTVQGEIRAAIQAFQSFTAWALDPLRFQQHWFGQPTRDLRRIVAKHWAARLPEVDEALANRPSEKLEYNWMRQVLQRLDPLVTSILGDVGAHGRQQDLEATNRPASNDVGAR